VQGAGFRHKLVRNGLARESELHVYIEGDGVPYKWGAVTKDPTSRSKLMLRLMYLDPTASIYVGRPCYMGLSTDPGCNYHYWTDRRFSQEVVSSMCRVITDETTANSTHTLVLIGHSGGGALAMLLALKCPGISSVITIGGNLDTDRWGAIHEYAPLRGSLNPAAEGPLPPGIQALHLVGSKDRVTPADFVSDAAIKTGGTVEIIAGFTHSCCWWKIWRAELSSFVQRHH
jgi:pimeloyl-ACP methyl ester carboxylesterase